MTKEEIIELVMQIGGCDRPEENSPALKMFETFAKLVAEHERERICEIVKEGLWDGAGIRHHLKKGDKNEV